METTDNLVRPDPPRDRIQAWLDWFGIARVVAAAGAVTIVCVGAYWLVRTPPPPSEASLPRATAAASLVPMNPPPGAEATGGRGAAGAVAAEGSEPATITVHVTGAVRAPGVYRLAGDARVLDAIEAAGGPSPGARADALNLAALVADGSRLYVPLIGEDVPELAAAPTETPATAPPGPVNLNRASAAELETLPGIGPATATAIVVERERNGPFLIVDDLDRVPGIGPAKLASLRDLVTT